MKMWENSPSYVACRCYVFGLWVCYVSYRCNMLVFSVLCVKYFVVSKKSSNFASSFEKNRVAVIFYC